MACLARGLVGEGRYSFEAGWLECFAMQLIVLLACCLPVYCFGYCYYLDLSLSTKNTHNTGVEMKT